MSQAGDRCHGMYWTRSDSAAALGHAPPGRWTGSYGGARGRRRERPQPAAETVKLFDRRLSLEALAVRIAGHEILIGPLRTLAASPEGTAATFARAPLPPLRALLRRGAAGAVPRGYAKVCEGSAWIEGERAALVAIRQQSD